MVLLTDAAVFAYPPMSRLPDEILCKIFISTRLIQEKPNGPWERSEKWDITWISLSHVSQRWRTAALNEPNLWINPPLWNPTWTQIMLQRSKMATLPEILLEPENMDVNVVASVLQHVARISDLTVCRTDLDNLERMLAALPSAAPILESLSINCLERHPYYDGVLFSVVPVVHGRYVDLTHTTGSAFSQAVRLRRLELSGILLNWNQALCGSVESFTLCDIPFDLHPRLHLKSILETMPNLTSLRLRDACPSSILPQYADSPFPLVYLKTISVGPTILQAIYFLEMVAISSATLVHVELEHDSFLADKTHTRRLLAVMRRAFPPAIISKPETLYGRLSVNDQRSSGELILRISKVCDTDYDLPELHSKTLRLTLMHVYHDDDKANFLDCFFQSFDACLPFEIGLNIGPNRQTWDILNARFLTTLSAIRRSVVLSCYSVNDFINVLLSNTNPVSTLILPSLQHICVVRCEFNDEFHTTATCPNAFDDLRKFIMERRDRGVPLTSLHISGRFNLSETYISSLKEIVEHVVWDEAGVNANFTDYQPTFERHEWHFQHDSTPEGATAMFMHT